MITPLSADQTLERARTALRSGRGAGLPELLELIESLSTNVSTVTISELAELVEKDAAVLTRVLQVANTVVHNPGIAPLTTLSHAIHQIGFTRVRNLAVSLMLLEHAGARNPPEQREAAARALCSGLLAQGCAEHFGYVDAEMAFACAAMRSFGHIILPAVSIEHYREAQKRLQRRPEPAAFRAWFGLTPLELSRRLLADTRLPEEVTLALRDCTADTIRQAPSQQDTRMLALVEFANRLAALSLDSGKGADVFAAESRKLSADFAVAIPQLIERLPAAFAHADHKLAQFLRCDGVSSLPTPSLNRIRARVRHLQPGEAIITPAESAAEPAVLVTAPQIAPAPLEPTLRDEPVQPIEWPQPAAPTVPPDAPAPFDTTPVADDVELADTWDAALDGARQIFHAQETWVFEFDAGRRSLSLRHGCGAHWGAFRDGAKIRPDERTVFGICLTRREAVVIHELRDPQLRRHLPAWIFGAEGAPRSFVLFPLFHEHELSGLALIGWHRNRQVLLDKAKLDHARQLLAQAQAFNAAAVGEFPSRVSA